MSITERESDLLAQAAGMVMDRESDLLLRRAARVITGWHEFAVDQKGRVVLPGPWRRALGAPFVLVPHPDGTLRGVRPVDWLQLVEVPLFRYGLSGSHIVEDICPMSGRFTIPATLRQHAALIPGCGVTLVGLGDSFRLLGSARWQAEKREIEREMLSARRGR